MQDVQQGGQEQQRPELVQYAQRDVHLREQREHAQHELQHHADRQ